MWTWAFLLLSVVFYSLFPVVVGGVVSGEPVMRRCMDERGFSFKILEHHQPYHQSKIKATHTHTKRGKSSLLPLLQLRSKKKHKRHQESQEKTGLSLAVAL